MFIIKNQHIEYFRGSSNHPKCIEKYRKSIKICKTSFAYLEIIISIKSIKKIKYMISVCTITIGYIV